EQLGEPFVRAPNHRSPGHGLDMAIARRAMPRHEVELRLGHHPDGGFIATLSLPLRRKATE
ncbi:two-component sensor histidine kinase, partial [Pseudomonas aeruginosa]